MGNFANTLLPAAAVKLKETQTMILNRLGNKTRIAPDIIQYFPAHRTFIDMFFGAGGIFFNKPLADYNFCNDIDDDVFNLYQVLKTDKENLIKEIEIMPMTENLLKHWNLNTETEPLQKAVRFICFQTLVIWASLIQWFSGNLMAIKRNQLFQRWMQHLKG